MTKRIHIMIQRVLGVMRNIKGNTIIIEFTLLIGMLLIGMLIKFIIVRIITILIIRQK